MDASMPLTDFLLFGLPAVLLTGLSKGGFGGAFGGNDQPLRANPPAAFAHRTI